MWCFVFVKAIRFPQARLAPSHEVLHFQINTINTFPWLISSQAEAILWTTIWSWENARWWPSSRIKCSSCPGKLTGGGGEDVGAWSGKAAVGPTASGLLTWLGEYGLSKPCVMLILLQGEHLSWLVMLQTWSYFSIFKHRAKTVWVPFMGRKDPTIKPSQSKY